MLGEHSIASLKAGLLTGLGGMRARIIWATLVCLAGFATGTSANDSDTERVSLTGLTTVSVVVEDLSAIAKKSGLVADTLHADVERRLKQAGISVTSDADAYLYVHVTVADPGPSLPLPYVVEVALMQEVTLPRGSENAHAAADRHVVGEQPRHVGPRPGAHRRERQGGGIRRQLRPGVPIG